MQKILLFLFLCVIGVFQFQLRYGRGGYVNDGVNVKEIDKQTLINKELIDRNNKMQLKISGLKGSSDALEARARSELNLIKQGEVLVLLPGNDIQIKPKK